MEESTSLVPVAHAATPQQQQPFNVNKMLVLARACAASGMYQNLKDVNKCLVKMMAGHELGLGPSASLKGIYIVKDQISLSANLLATLIRRSGVYDFDVVKMTDEVCTIDFFRLRRGEWVKSGTETFTAADARRAGTQNMGKFPKNMLFARAISNGQRFYCPDVTAGAPIYTPEELGAETDDEGNVVDAEVVATSRSTPHADAALVGKVKQLVDATGTNLDAFLGHFAASSIESMDVASLEEASKLLQVKYDTQQQRRHEHQQATTSPTTTDEGKREEC